MSKAKPNNESIFGILSRVYRLLDTRERKLALPLLGGIILNSFVDILGLAVVIPVIGLVVDPSAIKTNSFLSKSFDISHGIGIHTENGFLILLCVIMAGAFLFKGLFGLLTNLYQSRFSFSVAHRISGNMWMYHFTQSIERLRGTESGRILAEINVWPQSLARTFIVGSLLLINEVMVIAIISIGLAVYNFQVFMGISGLLILGFVIIRVTTKQRLASYSKTLNQLSPKTNTLITNAIRGFLELITFQAVSVVKDEYLKNTKHTFRVLSHQTVVTLAPSKLYEVLAIVALSGAIVISLVSKAGSDGFFELLTLLALSAYRIMPSMSRLNASFMGMQGQIHILTSAEKSAAFIRSSNPEINQTSAICVNYVDVELQNIVLGYESLERSIVNNLSATLSSGKVHAIVGPSGCGKSTLINAILGIHKPDHGQVVLTDSKSKVKIKKETWLAHTAYLSQQPFLFSGSIRDNLTLRVPGIKLDEEKVHDLIMRLELDRCLGPNPLDFQLNEGGMNLSGGEQQRLALLRAIQINRPVLIIDEATSALDARMSAKIIEILKEMASEGVNIIIVTHDNELAEKCDDILELTQL
ncbi:MAG TPA: ABC transporter ATP-binding protein [Flavobacteriales bacterium]|nr:ABC transporter ATP-binding protein [Flavobacteriales bacterium]